MAGGAETDGRWLTATGLLPVFIAASLFAGFLTAIPPIAEGGALRFSWAWAPALGVNISFFIDGLSLTFALLITGIGTLVMLYSAKYLAGHPQQARFSLYLVSFMLAMLGLVLADNLIGLFVFWELTTITSYMLIGFNHASETSRRAALQALLVTGTGGLAMLAGFVLIGTVAGTYELSEIRAMGGILRDSTLYLPIVILVLLGAFTKSAQVPFHFWLPNAMAAPTPVSAYLHSATMVKGGVYLMARMHPSLSGSDVWLWTLMIFGGVTAVFASVMALRQTDIKQTLAYTTLMALGTLTMFLSGQGAYAITAMAAFLVVHSLYKASLFLMIGCVDLRTGTRDADMLGGLARQMPVTAFAAALAALSMAGVPPFLGFIGKELLYKGALAHEASILFVTAATFAASALMFAIGGVVALRPFWGDTDSLPARHVADAEAPWPMLIGPLLLGALGLYFGLFPHWLQEHITSPTAATMLGSLDKAKDLHLWAGVNMALYLSLATFAAGIALYIKHRPLRQRLAELEDRSISFDRGWDKLLAGILSGSGLMIRQVQTGVLRHYLLTVFVVILLGMIVGLYVSDLSLDGLAFPDLLPKHYGVLSLTVAGTIVAVTTRSRIVAIVGLGVCGIGVSLIFILFGAPDVAITQLLVEVLVVVLFAVAALKLPNLPSRTTQPTRWGDAVLATAIGGCVTFAMMLITAGPIDRRLTEYFEVTSAPEAFGRNIVNVILVDFRALDTFGEITVVAVAALSALALLRQTGRRKRP
jgi:multicomponent Na+:H+ antiporter subunit A